MSGPSGLELRGVALFILLWWFSSRPRARYAVSGMFLVGYGAFRFFVEFFREPDAHLGFLFADWLTMGQLLSVPMLLAGGIFFAIARRRTSRVSTWAALTSPFRSRPLVSTQRRCHAAPF